jgi:hypothetical protein
MEARAALRGRKAAEHRRRVVRTAALYARLRRACDLPRHVPRELAIASAIELLRAAERPPATPDVGFLLDLYDACR